MALIIFSYNSCHYFDEQSLHVSVCFFLQTYMPNIAEFFFDKISKFFPCLFKNMIYDHSNQEKIYSK